VEDHAVAVSVARNPAQHDCVIEHGDSGVVADASARRASLACKGLAVPIASSAMRGWSFDPIAPPRGSLVVPVSLQASSGLSETYQRNGDQVGNSAFAAVHV
jgi:hypothetical protein